MAGLYTIDRFTFAGALSRFVRTVAARPGEATRLLAMDGIAIGLVVVFAGFAWPSFIETQPPGWQEGPLAACAAVALLLMYLMWETAWHRFMAGKPTRPGLPWRLGKEEGLLFGALVVAWILTFVLIMFAMAVLFPFGMVLYQVLGASPDSLMLLGTPLFLILFVIVYRFMCGVALTMVQGRMSVFNGVGGVRRHLWAFALATLLLTGGNWVVFEIFDLANPEPVGLGDLFGGRGAGSIWSMALIGAYLALSALSTHLFRGIYMESALVTANLGPVPGRGSDPDPLNTPAH